MNNAETTTTRPPIESDVIPAGSPYGQALLRCYDKATAEAEYRWKMGEIEGAFRNRQRDEAAQRRRDAMETDRFAFIQTRFAMTTPGTRTSLSDLKRFEDGFLQEQREKGHSTDSLEREIAEWRERYAADLAWWAETERRQAKEEADRQRKKTEPNRQLVEMLVQQLGYDNRAILLEVMEALAHAR